ncbi:MAG: helix-turn-helix domain-containing protein, partial [Acidimicrobiales bacterium]
AALGEPHRLAVVDELALADRSSSELASLLGIDSNLVAHHLNILEGAGLLERVHSQGDGRRRYWRLVSTPLAGLLPGPRLKVKRIVFVCTENAARSQLAQAIWNHGQVIEATSGGLQPAARVYPEAVCAARRRGLDLGRATPRPVPRLRSSDLVITVCDRAHEQLRARVGIRQLHWSVPDPAAIDDPDAYDAAGETLAERIAALAPRVER